MTTKNIPLANSKVLYDTLLEEGNYTVSRTTVRAGGETQWHHHSSVHDRFVVVSGVLTVEMKKVDSINKVEVRDYCFIDPRVIHHMKNETSEDAVYIMVQSGGKRDIVLE